MKKLLLLLLVGCASVNNNDVQPGDADAAIARQNQMLMRAVKAGNVDQLMNFYSDSAVIMPQGTPAMVGRDAVRAFWSGFLGANNGDLQLVGDDVVQSGDLAVERGHYELAMSPKSGGATTRESGKYIVVWRKINGEWRAVDDIFNSNSR